MTTKQATTVAVSTPSVGAVANTFLNPFAAIMPGSYYVPKSLLGATKADRDNPPLGFTGNVDFDKTLFTGGAVGATALALAALTRYGSHIYQKKKEEKERRKELYDVVDAANPIFSPDPYLDDAKKEQAERYTGASFEKNAELAGWLKAIIPLSMVAGGSYLGYAAVDKALEKRRKAKLEAEVAQGSNELDRLNYIKLMKARGYNMEDIPDPYHHKDSMPKEAGAPSLEESFWDTPKSLAALLALSTAVTSGILVKRHFDAEDPRRAEYKEMQAALKDMRMRRIRRKPINVAPLDPALVAKLNAHLTLPSAKKKSPAVLPASIKEEPVDIPEKRPTVDSTDPTMALL